MREEMGATELYWNRTPQYKKQLLYDNHIQSSACGEEGDAEKDLALRSRSLP